jgi:hypothetical protein
MNRESDEPNVVVFEDGQGLTDEELVRLCKDAVKSAEPPHEERA